MPQVLWPTLHKDANVSDNFLSYLGNVYVSDINNNRVRKITISTGIITTIAGSGSGSYSGDNGAATSATLNQPIGLALDSSNNVYISDSQNNRVRKITVATGIITTFAGTGSTTFSGDNGVATSASLSFPFGVAVDASGMTPLIHVLYVHPFYIVFST